MTESHQKNKFFKLARIILGILLIAIGLFALVTPLTPGAWLAIIGLELIGIRIVFLERIKEGIRDNSYTPSFIKKLFDKLKNGK